MNQDQVAGIVYAIGASLETEMKRQQWLSPDEAEKLRKDGLAWRDQTLAMGKEIAALEKELAAAKAATSEEARAVLELVEGDYCNPAWIEWDKAVKAYRASLNRESAAPVEKPEMTPYGEYFAQKAEQDAPKPELVRLGSIVETGTFKFKDKDVICIVMGRGNQYTGYIETGFIGIKWAYNYEMVRPVAKEPPCAD